ncbi:MAG: leucine-rich repeat protein, partial [Ruminococcus sp.]|nr:leucine-rich repeat protein [Candidatus Apopatosoma intestinale]
MKKKTFVRIVCLCLCLAMLIGSVMPMLAVGIVITEEGTYLDEKPSVVKINGRVADVEALIDAIGTVAYSDDSLAKIVAAEKAYGKLTDELKYQVKNSGLLKSLRNAYDALAADHVDTSALTPVDSGSIGEVKWTVYESGLLEFSGSGSIPSYSHGESPWYGYRDSVTSILVRSSVWTIGGEAFYGCNNVTNVTLPFVGESRTATGIAGQFGYIFGYKRSSSSCSSSEFDNGSSSSSFAPGYGYYHSDNYGSSYYYYTFNTPSKINSVTFTVATRLAKAAFHNCGYITKIVLNDGITSVGDYAFY